MGIFGKIGHWVGDRIGNGPSVSGLKSSIKGTGKLAEKVAPIAAFVPGVGPLAAAALAAGGSLAAGHNLKESVISGAKNYGVGKVLGAAGKIPGVSKLGGALSHIPGVSKLEGLVHDIPGASSIGGFLKDHGQDILTAAQGVQAYGQQQDANNLRDQGLGYATHAYDEKAPIRSMALQEMQNEQLPDLSSIYADSGNPYAKMRGVSPVGR